MPELPEVETIARGLAPELIGQRIVAAEVRGAKAVGGDAALFTARVVGRAVEGVHRRGKMLLLDLDVPREKEGGLFLAVHLKMTGRLWVPPEGTGPDVHTHVVMRLLNGRELHFRDVRKFGWCRCLTGDELAAMPFFRTLGPEPLEIGPEEFLARLEGRRGRIKALLLDQKVVAGIGNIYADEALFRAGIRPEARADALSAARLRRLFAEVQEVLRQGIRENGASISDYRDARGDAGAFQNSFRVYGRGGEPCVACGGRLRAVTVAGRTSTYCPRCQKG
ncbi:Formamidopyrimidine-DNA glycosylase [Desulfovibrio sp. X2]|uniref:bifunctional DNA-formamidopyrimidine glycosylase/DNA-(apurinic or apyrimidinic site) lyase n=1 Tax=Desulfovibrio sp. X2 TaxID=941449 RepID=UPI000358A4DB|nr:bifunctional DNA-formamidopyrimidine glycosylase/DNA-(apurinic or apyrimidinic site) lyase [Desulfovibrio sp. X2]EPR37089.1 Formamidopyrimidine-DNA glycosylase [Desulfovibrio sp. X2]